MPAQSAAAPPPWSRFIIDHNPFFLLSAICMMVGCHALSMALYTPAGDTSKLLVLVAVINIYEVALIALGITLLRRAGAVQRDAHTLLALEAFFLTDLTFVNGVISTIDARWGWGLSAVLMALALVKVMVIARALQFPRSSRILILVLIQMAVLLLVPTVFKQVAMRHKGGFLPELAVYFAWWVAGLVPVLATALLWPPPAAEDPQRHKSGTALAGVYLAVPFISILVHVYSAGWVYNFYLKPAEVSPLLLGIAVCASLLRHRIGAAAVIKWQTVLIVGALLFSLHYRNSMVFNVGDYHFNPLRLTAIGSFCVVLHILWLYRRTYAVAAAGLGIAGVLLWPSLPGIYAMLQRAVPSAANALKRLIPKTAGQWGVTAIVAAFVLLAVGALFSLRRRPLDPAPEPHAEPPAPEGPPEVKSCD